MIEAKPLTMEGDETVRECIEPHEGIMDTTETTRYVL
jgi:hypothetical protein